MKTKLIITLLLFVFFRNLFADTKSAVDFKSMSISERKQYHERKVMEQHGGFVTVKGTPSGSIIVFNSQKRIGSENFDFTSYVAGNWMKEIIKIVEGPTAVTPYTADAIRKKANADFAIFIIEDKLLPPSLIAIESQWAILNITALGSKNIKDEILTIRAKNEFSRVFSVLCGGFSSHFSAKLFNAITQVEDLDYCSANPPGDIAAKIKSYLNTHGIKERKRVFYRKACEEGWAPAPTNEYQKAIWNKVHAMPTAPIKIKPETKKVTE